MFSYFDAPFLGTRWSQTWRAFAPWMFQLNMEAQENDTELVQDVGVGSLAHKVDTWAGLDRINYTS